MIRPATDADAAQIGLIWNSVIRDTIATFNAVEKTTDDLCQMIAAQRTFVAVDGADVLGFVTYGQFRGGIGYQFTAEHTIHLHAKAQGKGIGRALMDTLCEHARSAGFHSMWAGISAENTAGVAFHERTGFSHIARLPEVGHKFGRWHDLVLMQKRL